MLKAVLSPLQQLAAKGKSSMLNIFNRQDWEVLPDGQANATIPMTKPAPVPQTLQLGTKTVGPDDILGLLKAAAEHPPRDAAAVTAIMGILAARSSELT